MPAWLLRGLTLALVHAAGSVTVAKIAVFQPTDRVLVTSVTFAVLLGVALTWGALDGWLRKPDGGRTWVLAALVAGPVAGILNVIGRAVFVDQTRASELVVQLTNGAAFVALMVLVPAAIGLFVGGRLDAPDRPKGVVVQRSPETPPTEDIADADGTAEEQRAARPRPGRVAGRRPAPRPRPTPGGDDQRSGLNRS